MEAPTYVQGNDLLELLQVHEDRTVSCLTAQFQQQFQRFSQSLLAAFTPDPPEPLKSRLSTDVKQLQYKLKKHALCYALKGLKPDMNPTRLSIPHHHRMSTVHEILVCLSLAHDDWAAAHIQNYIPSDSTQQTDNTNQSIYKDINVPVQTRLQVTARKLELHLIKLVEKDRSGQATGNLYVQKVKAFRTRLVDDPVGQLKSAIVSSHGVKNVNVAMPL
jgi:hypothetical protein